MTSHQCNDHIRIFTNFETTYNPGNEHHFGVIFSGTGGRNQNKPYLKERISNFLGDGFEVETRESSAQQDGLVAIEVHGLVIGKGGDRRPDRLIHGSQNLYDFFFKNKTTP